MKLPSFQFYPGDWMKDPNLSRASLSAKGALVEILCLAFECEKRGVLKTGSHAWTIEEISRAMRGSNDENEKAIRELLVLKVLKKDRKNAIFSSRMCKDEKLRKVRREAGLKGGNPNLLNQTANQKPTPSSSSSVSSSVNKEIESLKVVRDYYADFENQINADQRFVEMSCMSWSLSVLGFATMLHDFISSNRALEKKWKDYADCKSNFHNWGKKEGRYMKFQEPKKQMVH
jgi:hypothetical protein